MTEGPALILEETADTLTYRGVGEDSGYCLTITKDDDFIEVHQVIPITMVGAGETWQELRDRLAVHL